MSVILRRTFTALSVLLLASAHDSLSSPLRPRPRASDVPDVESCEEYRPLVPRFDLMDEALRTGFQTITRPEDISWHDRIVRDHSRLQALIGSGVPQRCAFFLLGFHRPEFWQSVSFRAQESLPPVSHPANYIDILYQVLSRFSDCKQPNLNWLFTGPRTLERATLDPIIDFNCSRWFARRCGQDNCGSPSADEVQFRDRCFAPNRAELSPVNRLALAQESYARCYQSEPWATTPAERLQSPLYSSIDAPLIERYGAGVVPMIRAAKILVEELALGGSFQDFQARLGARRSSFSFDDIVHLVRFVGLLGNWAYEYERNNILSPSSVGVVNGDRLLGALRSNLGLTLNPGAPAPFTQAGICRDIAPFQAAILERLGVRAFVISGTVVPVAMHSWLVFVDPRDPNLVHTIDYGDMSTGSSRGGVPSRVSSVQFRLFRVEHPEFDNQAEYMGTIPGPLSPLLTISSGMIPDTPLRLQMQNGLLTGGTHGHRQLRLLSRGNLLADEVRTHLSTQLVSISFSRSYMRQGVLGQSALLFGVTSFLHQSPGFSSLPIQAAGVLGFAQANLSSHELRVARDSIGLRLEVAASAFLLAMTNASLVSSDQRSGTAMDAAGIISLGARARLGNEARDRVVAYVRSQLQVSLAPSDVRDAGSMGLLFERLLSSVEIRARLGRTVVGRAILLASIAWIVDRFGQRVDAQAAFLHSSGLFVGANHQRMVAGDIASTSFLPGANPTTALFVGLRCSDRVRCPWGFQLEWRRQEDVPAPGYAPGVGGGGTPAFLGAATDTALSPVIRGPMDSMGLQFSVEW